MKNKTRKIATETKDILKIQIGKYFLVFGKVIKSFSKVDELLKRLEEWNEKIKYENK